MGDSRQTRKSVLNEITRVLVVEDEVALREAYRRILAKAGFSVATAGTGDEAMAVIGQGLIDCVVSDIDLPGMSGNDLLKAVRKMDSGIPVILVTGYPTIESASEAVEYGALRYLVKPVDASALVSAVENAVRHTKTSRRRRAVSLEEATQAGNPQSRDDQEASFVRGLESLWMAFHPIVNAPGRVTIGHEALVRTREPSIPHPGVFFDLAERLGRLEEIGRAIRSQVAHCMDQADAIGDFYVNVHPRDLFDERLFCAQCPLTAHSHRVVLEITERAALKKESGVKERIAKLRDMGYRIAIDDLGEGYAGLNWLASLSPDVVKLDMGLIRNIHVNPVRQRLVDAVTKLCGNLDMRVIAEGIETREEQRCLTGLGCDVHQGFLYAKPGPPFPQPVFE